jgi:NADPH2:quinone reductase
MKAIVCKEFGPPSALVLEEMEPLSPKKNEILIDIHAAGVNFPDTLIIKDMYQFKPALPFTPGNEVAGIVSAVGEEVTNYKVGDEVMAMPPFGGYAEQIIATPSQVSKKPANMDFATAACFSTTYGTSHYGLKDKAKLKEGETVLILGASGGVGISAIEIAKAMGAKVIAAASTDEKLGL